MKKVFCKGRGFLLAFAFSSFSQVNAQEIAIQGKIIDEGTNEPTGGVSIVLEGTSIATNTSVDGEFVFYHPLPPGEQILIISKEGFLTVRYPVVIEKGTSKNLDLISIRLDFLKEQQQTGFITLSDDDLNEEEGNFDNVSGLLQASKDVFLSAAAFDFSSTFFRPRGLDSENGKLLINGIEMNKVYSGRPQWSNWGGLNDVQRNQVFTMGLAPSEVSFGGLAGTTNIIMRASEYSKGGKVSYAVSNRAYSGRIMGSYSSGLNQNGWAYTFSLARRFAEESFRQGTLYDANSFFVAVEKKINNAQSLNFSGFYTPVRRGKTSASTQEVFDLKGIKYNSFWGYQDGELRNSRIGIIEEPVLMLNHFWKPSKGTVLNTNIGYQFGKVGNSRLDYGGSRLYTGDNGEELYFGGGRNPDPAYYQKLPSYFFRFEDNPNFQEAYLAQQEFLNDGQIDWTSMYSANMLSTVAGGNSVYMLYEDRNDDKLFNANTILQSQITPNILLNASIGFQNLKSENFARVLDLLGGNAFLDVDSFSEGLEAQNNLLSPNFLAAEGDKIKYHFELSSNILNAFAQAQFNYKNVDFFTSIKASETNYQRTGFFKNGNFPNNSLGGSEMLNFTDYGGKAGVLYKFTGKHLFGLNAGYFTRAPNLRNSFSNSRQNNDVVLGLESEKIGSVDISYIFRSPLVKSRLTGYFTQFRDATEISFYYADGISGLGRNSTTAFVQEVLYDIQKRHVGLEFGIEAQVTQTIKLKAAAGIGEFIYNNNPNLYLTSDDFDDALQFGQSYLRNYKIAGGPQRAFQIGFEYRDPKFWFVSGSINYFSHTFLDVAPLTRTHNFATDADGLPLLNYNEEVARSLLEQERFGDYSLVNLIGGKSWRVKKYFIGVFASINNIFNTEHKTGGYEQSRNANFRTLKADQERDQPIFGPKYWYGTGTTYYSHLYVRF